MLKSPLLCMANRIVKYTARLPQMKKWLMAVQ